ncbi:MAG: LCP family protein [Lachnospiraceae bacterium]|nr:LCP family protein [Lachnospiraceae bacterium]
MNENEIKEGKKRTGWKRHAVLYTVEGLVLIAAIFVLFWVTRATKMQKVNLDTNNIAVNEQSSASAANGDSSGAETGEVMSTNSGTEADVEQEAVSEPTVDKEAVSKELYDKYSGRFNIAFFGVDSREGELGKGTRSDSIMICSIDMQTHEVKLISVFRDTYLNLGNDSYNKCNSAYAIGGPEQALSMINMNTDLAINDYITVGFSGLIDAVDSLGGVDIELTEEEIVYLNDYAMMMSQELDIPYTPVQAAGKQTLNGLQATAYCRIRYTAGSDFRRAERQRDVLTAMLLKAKTVPFSSLSSAVSAIMPNVSTSLNVDDFLKMISVASDYEVTVSDGFPFEGMRNGGTIGQKGSCVVPTDLTKNVRHLHELLYEDESYEPSDSIKKYSQKIKADTDEFLQY